MRAQIIQFIIVQNTNSKKLPTRGWVIITHLSVWFRAGESSYKKTMKKKKRRSQSIWDTGRPSVTVKHGEQEQLMCPYTCWPSQVLLCCSSKHSEDYSDLPLSYLLPSANIHFCITPLESHSLTNGKEHKGIRCCILSSWDHIFSAASTWDNEKLVFSETLCDNITNTGVS